MRIVAARSFLKDLRGVPAEIRAQLSTRAALFLENSSHPLLKNHALHGEWVGHRSINITGDYRVIYRTIDENCIFIRIGTHSELYE